MRMTIGFAITGFVLLVAGFGLLYRPLGLIVAGALMLGAAMKQGKKT